MQATNVDKYATVDSSMEHFYAGWAIENIDYALAPGIDAVTQIECIEAAIKKLQILRGYMAAAVPSIE